ncbi:unnamed protein product [Pylaiella littoralis]
MEREELIEPAQTLWPDVCSSVLVETSGSSSSGVETRANYTVFAAGAMSEPSSPAEAVVLGSRTPPGSSSAIYGDILDMGLDGSSSLSAFGRLSSLSASAAEFTPGSLGRVEPAFPVSGRDEGGQTLHVKEDEQQQYQQQQKQYTWEQGEEGAVALEGDEDTYYAEVQLEAEVLELMAETFSDCSLESLQVALAKSDWDLERASSAVLAALETACDPSLARKPCRHLLLGGECRRSDCAFRHDFATTPCRFWLQGQCANPSEACHFLHDLDVPAHEEGLPLPDGGGGVAAGEVMELEEGDTGDASSNKQRGPNHVAFGIEEFPSLESKTRTSSSKPAPNGSGVTGNGAARTAQRSSGWTVDRTVSGTVNGTEITAAIGAAPVDGSDRSWQLAQQPLDEASPRKKYDKKEEEEEEEEDVLLAAVVAATKQGGRGGRKGGRGRKTRYTAVSLQALMKPSANPPIAGGGETTKERATTTVAGHNNNNNNNDNAPSLPLPSFRHYSGAHSKDASRGNPASGSSGSGNSTGSGGNDGIGGLGLVVTPVAARNDMSFADIVGSSPPLPPQSSSTATASTRKSGSAGVPADLPGAWGGSGGRSEDGAVVQSSNSSSGAGAGAAVIGGRREWVSTGDAVAVQYEQARREAAELARARNKLFTSATEAFRRGGQGAIARDLARRGRELNSRMKEKHREAAREIFTSRNPGDQVFERRTMDLHGLHVSEAMEVLDREVAALAERGLSGVRILTGSGHHSKGPTNKARLIPAVENFCQARGYPVVKVPDQSTGHVGAVDINFAELLEWTSNGYEGQEEEGQGGSSDYCY